MLEIDKSLTINNNDIIVPVEGFDDIIVSHADKLEDIIPVEILEEIDIASYTLIERLFSLVHPRLKFVSVCTCILCGYTNTFRLTKEQLVDMILPMDFITMYKYEAYMKLRGYSIPEIMNMYPYELDIYKSSTENLMNQTE
jgi:hypothetical protein